MIGPAYTAEGRIIATGQLSSPPTTLEGLAESLKLEMAETAVRPEVDLCRAILQSHSVRQKLVRQYDLELAWELSSEQATVEMLQRCTRIETQAPCVVQVQVRLSGLPWLWARGEANDKVRRLSASLANSYIETLQSRLSEFHLSAAKRKRVFLKKKREETLAQLHNAEEALHRWESANKLISADDARKLATEQLVKLQERYEQIQLEFGATSEEIAQATQLLRDQPQMQIASLEQEANPLILQLREKLVQLEANLAMAVEVRGETEFYPEVEELVQEIETTKEALAEQQRQQMFTSRRVDTHNPAVEALVEQLLPLQIKRAALAAKHAGLKRAIGEAERGIIGLSAQGMEYGRLLREVKVRAAIYQVIGNEYEQALVTEQADEPRVYVLDEATPPEHSSAPRVGSNMALAAFGGMIISTL